MEWGGRMCSGVDNVTPRNPIINIHGDSEGKLNVFWEAILTVMVRQKVHMNACHILNG
jgi:hypothetical protein